MADTRRANGEYQLDVDTMVLEYLVSNTLKVHLDEWNPDHREQSEKDSPGLPESKSAPTLLSILDTHIHLFKANHPRQDFSANTAFYLKLLEFLLLFTHERGGPSALSDASHWQARKAGQENVRLRLRCWEGYEMSSYVTVEERDLLRGRPLVCDESTFKRADDGVLFKSAFPGVPLVDLMPRFMELSARMSEEMKSEVSEIWLDLASEFMIQAAIEIGFNGTSTPESLKIDQAALLACFGWGLPIYPDIIPFVMEDDDSDTAAAEQMVQRMLVSTSRVDYSQTPWHKCRTSVVREVMQHIRGDEYEECAIYQHVPNLRRGRITLHEAHPTTNFEIQLVDYIRGLQHVWSQLNGEPILTQIEQGRLDGLNDDEFNAFMARVGTDEEEAILP